jgi:GAF domain-containing protein
LTRIAAGSFKAPIALLSFIDRDRQFIKSCYGLDVQEISCEIAFCAHTILSNEVLVVPDAQADHRFVHNPLVTGEPGIRYYVGAPLKTHDGFCIGSLCVIDTVPHPRPTRRELAVLEDLAAEVVEQLEFRFAKRELSVFKEALAHRERELKEHQAYRHRSECCATLALEAGHMVPGSGMRRQIMLPGQQPWSRSSV